jgi:superfamily II DNA helicase RecQ
MIAQQLSQLKEKYPETAIIALTATATERVQKDIINQLRLADPVFIQSDFNRPNLYYSVRLKKGKKTTDEEILEYILERPNQTGIIYCLSRNECEEVAQFLKQAGVSADYYHAQLGMSISWSFSYFFLTFVISLSHLRSIIYYLYYNMIWYMMDIDPEVRNNVQMSWLNDDIQVIVATIAFGLGINKPEVR